MYINIDKLMYWTTVLDVLGCPHFPEIVASMRRFRLGSSTKKHILYIYMSLLYEYIFSLYTHLHDYICMTIYIDMNECIYI